MNDYELSVVIPSRNEEWLNKTIQDILEHKKAKTQIIIGLDGQWPVEPIQTHPDVVVLFFPESIGQRAITNQCVNLSRAKYIMKLDAHCALDDGFDVKMIEAFKKSGDDVVMAPTMRNLHVFNWVCPDGHIRYQGPSGPCKECGKETVKDVVWNPKTNPQSVAYCFDSEPHFQYMNELKNRQSYKDQGDMTESMSLQGSCFMLTRKLYWELNICDEAFGTWGSQGIEVACKFWLSGRKVLINHNTWYAHCFRTQGGSFGFPYELSGKQVAEAKKLAGNKLYENKWPYQVLPSIWLIDRFWPCPGWDDSSRSNLAESGASFVNQRFEELRVLGIIPPTPSTVANHTTSMPVDGWREKMSIVAMGLSKLFSGSSVALQDISSVRDELQVGRITTQPIITNMVKNWNIPSLTIGDVVNQPSIHKSVNPISNLVDTDIPVPVGSSSTSPDPAMSNGVNFNFGKDSVDGLNGDVHNTSIPSKGIIYYTDNQLDPKIMKACQKQLWKGAVRDHKMPIVSCSLKPMDFGTNIVLPLERGYLTMTKQILTALEALDTDIVYFCEHDVLYHPSHFEFTPEDRNTWYYNANYWFLRLTDGFAISYNASPLSGLCVYRDIAIKHYKERIALIEQDQFKEHSMYNIGFEPMTHNRIKWSNSYSFKTFMSSSPNIDISHGANVTKKRWSIDLFRKKPTKWVEGNIDTIEGWDNVRKLLR